MTSELKKASVGPAFFGSILLLLLFGLVVAAWVRFGGRTESYDDKRAADRIAKLSALEKENRQRLTVYGWVHKDKGVVQIPIDDAMKLALPELKSKPVQASAVKVENPYPAGLQQAPPAASAAPIPAATAAPTSTSVSASAPSASASPAPASAATPMP